MQGVDGIEQQNALQTQQGKRADAHGNAGGQRQLRRSGGLEQPPERGERREQGNLSFGIKSVTAERDGQKRPYRQPGVEQRNAQIVQKGPEV